MGGNKVFARIRTAVLGATSLAAILAVFAPAANANLLSLLPGSCGNQPSTQPFAQFGDYSSYTPVPGGTFEAGSPGWKLSGGAQVVSGNESYNVSGTGSHSLSLPAGSSALSPASCTSIYNPTARLFVRNTGSSQSRLVVEAVYPTLLGTLTTPLGEVSASSHWAPSPTLGLLLSNALSTLSLNQTTVAFRFVPADSSGQWSIDDVYLDPFMRR
jgi:hypothetical protein